MGAALCRRPAGGERDGRGAVLESCGRRKRVGAVLESCGRRKRAGAVLESCGRRKRVGAVQEACRRRKTWPAERADWSRSERGGCILRTEAAAGLCGSFDLCGGVCAVQKGRSTEKNFIHLPGTVRIFEKKRKGRWMVREKGQMALPKRGDIPLWQSDDAGEIPCGASGVWGCGNGGHGQDFLGVWPGVLCIFVFSACFWCI